MFSKTLRWWCTTCVWPSTLRPYRKTKGAATGIDKSDRKVEWTSSRAEQEIGGGSGVCFMPEQSFGDDLDRRLHDQVIITSVQSVASLFSVISLFAPLPIIRKVAKKKSTGMLQNVVPGTSQQHNQTCESMYTVQKLGQSMLLPLSFICYPSRFILRRRNCGRRHTSTYFWIVKAKKNNSIGAQHHANSVACAPQSASARFGAYKHTDWLSIAQTAGLKKSKKKESTQQLAADPQHVLWWYIRTLSKEHKICIICNKHLHAWIHEECGSVALIHCAVHFVPVRLVHITWDGHMLFKECKKKGFCWFKYNTAFYCVYDQYLFNALCSFVLLYAFQVFLVKHDHELACTNVCIYIYMYDWRVSYEWLSIHASGSMHMRRHSSTLSSLHACCMHVIMHACNHACLDCFPHAHTCIHTTHNCIMTHVVAQETSASSLTCLDSLSPAWLLHMVGSHFECSVSCCKPFELGILHPGEEPFSFAPWWRTILMPVWHEARDVWHVSVCPRGVCLVVVHELLHASEHARTHACTPARTHARMHTRTHKLTYIHTHGNAFVHKHTNIHTFPPTLTAEIES